MSRNIMTIFGLFAILAGAATTYTYSWWGLLAVICGVCMMMPKGKSNKSTALQPDNPDPHDPDYEFEVSE